MLAQQFGWAREPFSATPEPREIYVNAAIDAVSSKLMAAITHAKGLSLVLGETGIGKTALLQKLRWYLRPSPVTLITATPTTSINDVICAACTTLGVPVETGTTRAQGVRALAAKSIELLKHRNFTPILVDEAEKLDHETLLALHQLAEVTSNERRLFPVILAARPELEATLEDARLRPVRQGLVETLTLRRMTPEEVACFVAHQIKSAGGAIEVKFEPAALALLAAQSNGLPELVNLICSQALINAALENRHSVTRAHVEVALRQCAPRSSAEVHVLKRGSTVLAEAARLASGLRVALGGGRETVLFEDAALTGAGTVVADGTPTASGPASVTGAVASIAAEPDAKTRDVLATEAALRQALEIVTPTPRPGRVWRSLRRAAAVIALIAVVPTFMYATQPADGLPVSFDAVSRSATTVGSKASAAMHTALDYATAFIGQPAESPIQVAEAASEPEAPPSPEPMKAEAAEPAPAAAPPVIAAPLPAPKPPVTATMAPKEPVPAAPTKPTQSEPAPPAAMASAPMPKEAPVPPKPVQAEVAPAAPVAPPAVIASVPTPKEPPAPVKPIQAEVAPVAAPAPIIAAPPVAPPPAAVAERVSPSLPPPVVAQPVAPAPEPKPTEVAEAAPPADPRASLPRVAAVAPAVTVPAAPSTVAAAAFVLRGNEMLRTGDVAAARLFYQRAAEQGYGPAAMSLAKTYDPIVLRQLGVRGAQSDRDAALTWYRRALELGDAKAEAPLQLLQRQR
jgi:type II secretory pathway predicted ATPase ExeA